MQETKVLRAGRLTRKPKPIHIRPQILMHLEGRRGGPIGVTPKGPGGGRPARVHESDGVRDSQIGIHVPQDGHDFALGDFVGLALDTVGFLRDNGDEEDVGVGEEVRCGEGLPDGIVAAADGIGVKEVLCIAGPEGLVELEENLGVGAHGEFLDGGLFPGW